MAIFSVIGANYGDEGKGLITDFLVSQNPNSIVIRFNGGAQAGHTVEHDCNGLVYRHAFGHFGSGSFLGAPTYLSRFFVVNPFLFINEYYRLIKKLPFPPKVFIDPLCPVTLPCDILINQDIEKKRGNNRHGSCGVGFGETIERHAHPEYRLTFGDLLTEDYTKIVDRSLIWYKERRNQLGLLDSDLEECKKFHSVFFDVVAKMKQKVLLPDSMQYDNIVFEGAQGLLLDMDNKNNFPFVTRSNTGLKNVIDICSDLGIKEKIQAVYVSRCYLTRHGADLRFEDVPYVREFFNIQDKTNVVNDWQGNLKVDALNPSELIDRIKQDTFKFCVSNVSNVSNVFNISNISVSIALTCLDQVIDSEKFISKDILNNYHVSSEVNFLNNLAAFNNVKYIVRGPKRSNVIC